MNAPDKKALVQRAVDLVAGEVLAILSSWERSRGNPELAADDAIDLLAAWGHLQRFDGDRLPAGLWNRLNQVVSADGDHLSRLVPEALDPAGWLTAVEVLRAATDNAVTEEDHYAVNAQALVLFQQLDEAELATWAARRIRQAQGLSGLAALETLWQQLLESASVFAAESDLFGPARWYASGLLVAYRQDLLGFDADLWGTVAKYEIADAEGQELDRIHEPPPPMSQAEWQALSGGTVQVAPLVIRVQGRNIRLRGESKPSEAGGVFSVDIFCESLEGEAVSCEGWAVFIEPDRGGENSWHCFLDERGRARVSDLPAGKYRLSSPGVSGRSREPIPVEQLRGAPPEGQVKLRMYESTNGRARATLRQTEYGTTIVAVETKDASLAGARVRFAFVQKDSGKIEYRGETKTRLQPVEDEQGLWEARWEGVVSLAGPCEFVFAVDPIGT